MSDASVCAHQSGLEIDSKNGGIVVNQQLEALVSQWVHPCSQRHADMKHNAHHLEEGRVK
jgi:hypothetical protein